MRHFDQLEPAVRDVLFHRAPQSFDRDSERAVLAQSLGATLYVPATKEALAGTVRRQAAQGVRSIVIDLEDAISDGSVDRALTSTAGSLCELNEDPVDCLVFVRVRRPGHIHSLADHLGPALGVVSGFVLPKFSVAAGAGYLQAVADADEKSEHPVYAMPVIETPQALYRESRDSSPVSVSCCTRRATGCCPSGSGRPTCAGCSVSGGTGTCPSMTWAWLRT